MKLDECRMGAGVEAAVRQHAAATYPDECCGALLGTSSDAAGVSILEAVPLANVTAEGPRRRFRVSPDDYRQAEARSAQTGTELIGFYHSHPDHPAVPSQYDLDHAWPNLSYVIVSIVQGSAAAIRSWRLRPDRSAFEEERITGDREMRNSSSVL